MTALAIARAGAQWVQPRIEGRRVFLAVLAVTAFVVLTAAVQSYRAIQSELTDGALSRRGALAEVTAAALAGRFEQLTDVGVALSTGTRFRSLVGERHWIEALSSLRTVPQNFPLIDRLFLTSFDGTVRATLPDHIALLGANLAHHDWHQAVRRGARAYVSPAYRETDTGDQSIFLVATPIRDFDDRMAGMLILGVRMDEFLQWAKGLMVGPEASISVVGSHGRIIFHSRHPQRADAIDFGATPIGAKLARREHGVELVRDPVRREQVVSAYAPVGTYGWGVVVDEPARLAFAARDSQLQRLLTAYALTLLLVTAVLYLGLRLAEERRKAGHDRQMKAELEHQVAERTAELEATNKELESFSYSVSHDLRSPLRAITGFTRMLEEDSAEQLDAEGKRMLGVIRDNGVRMGRLIDDLLAFSRLGRKPLVCAETDMRALVDEAIAEVKHDRAYAQREVIVEALPPAWCDRRLVQQVWGNLISNALKFSARSENPRIVISASEDEASVTYSVKDNGAGFDMRFYDKLFGVFQRLHSDEDFAGTGVGLAIVQRVVTRHGGRVWAEGRPGKGAAFHFTLPRAAPAPADDAASEAPS